MSNPNSKNSNSCDIPDDDADFKVPDDDVCINIPPPMRGGLGPLSNNTGK